MDDASRRDGDGDIEQVGFERFGRARAFGGVPGECQLDLWTGGEVAIDGLVGVDPGDAVAVDDDDPRSGAVAVLVGRYGVEGTVAFEVVFVEGG